MTATYTTFPQDVTVRVWRRDLLNPWAQPDPPTGDDERGDE